MSDSNVAAIRELSAEEQAAAAADAAKHALYQRMDEIELQHGPCHFERANGVLYAWRRPNEAELHRFTNAIASGGDHFGAAKDKIVACCVEPGQQACHTLVRKMPAVVLKVNGLLDDLALDGLETLKKGG